MTEPRIAAIVLSFNRLGMVQRCIESLRAQTRPLDDIVVVDASSKPEVVAWLDAQTDVRKVYVDDLGSAGGMHFGMKKGCEQGYDWLWVFDDDVVAKPDALEQLLKGLKKRPDVQIINSLSLRENDPNRPSVGAVVWRKNPDNYLFGSKLVTVPEVLATADADGFIDTLGAQLYQGTLIHCAVIQKIGVTRIEFFTRGEEVEWGLRAMQAGYHMYIYVHSIVTHPSSGTEFVELFGKRFPYQVTPDAKRYYNIRNSIWIRKEYYRDYPFLPYVARRFATGMLGGVVLDPSQSFGRRMNGAVVLMRAVRDGLQFRSK